MRAFVAFTILGLISHPIWALNGKFEIPSVSCERQMLPNQLADASMSLTFGPSGTVEAQVSFLGWMGGDCTGRAGGRIQQDGGQVTIHLDGGEFAGSFTSPCRDLVDSVSGTFALSQLPDGKQRLQSQTCSLLLNGSQEGH